MKLILKILSFILILIGILYSYIAIMAIINVDFIEHSLIRNSIVEIPLSYFPQLKYNILRNNILILIFGVTCLIIGGLIFRKGKHI